MIKRLNTILRKVGVQLKKTEALEKEQLYFKNTISCLEELYNYRNNASGIHFNNQMTGIVFSKNRAMQLHALLSSYFFYTQDPAPLKILFTTDSAEHRESYNILQQEFNTMPVEFIRETNFREQLISVASEIKADRIFFMTDDALFVEAFNFLDCMHFNPLQEIVSLRLGKDVDYSFTYNKDQVLPSFVSETIENQQMYSWIWKDSENAPDWCYPLSLDATVFGRDELNIILAHTSFKNPNSLEANLQIFINVFLPRKGVCYEKAVYVNVPCNVVQTDFDNIFTGTYSVSALLHLFLAGKRINWKLCHGMKAKNVQHIKYEFI